MNIDNLTSAVDKVAVKGFIRRDLKNWFIDDYIKRTLLDMCRKYREELFNRVSIYFTNGKDGSEKGYYIPAFEIAFGEAQKYEVNDRGWLDKPLHLFKEEEIKYLFVDIVLIIFLGLRQRMEVQELRHFFAQIAFLLNMKMDALTCEASASRRRKDGQVKCM